MAEADDPSPNQESSGGESGKSRFPLKAAIIVLVAFGLQVGVVLLVFNLYRPASASGGGTNADAGEAPPPSAGQTIVDLGTFNVTQFTADAANRCQLSVTLSVCVTKEDAEAKKVRLIEQKSWIGQLLDEVIGQMPMKEVHPSRRQELKAPLKTRINERLGENVVEEVILTIQAFGP